MNDEKQQQVKFLFAQVVDALTRCIDGMESETWHYAAEQAKRAQKTLHELAFRCDLFDLIETVPIPVLDAPRPWGTPA